VSIHAIPTNDDQYGQLSGRELVLNAKLFSITDLGKFADMNRDAREPSRFGMDEPNEDHSGATGAFMPLAEAPNFFLEVGAIADIFGLLLKAVDNQELHTRKFQRVGFAAVSHIDGCIGGSAQRHIENWKSPPWPREDLERVVIV
jgi:hypothetical protein